MGNACAKPPASGAEAEPSTPKAEGGVALVSGGSPVPGADVQPAGPKAGVTHTTEGLPASLQHWPNGAGKYIRVSKSTYAANAPNEDRCTVAVDTNEGTILAGVWDGHAGARSFHCEAALPLGALPHARVPRRWAVRRLVGPQHHRDLPGEDGGE